MLRGLLLVFISILGVSLLHAQAPDDEAGSESKAIKLLEVRNLSRSFAQRQLPDFWDRHWNTKKIIYIINYGTNSEIARRERLIIDSTRRREQAFGPRITLVCGGRTRPAKTIFWKVPPGERPPI